MLLTLFFRRIDGVGDRRPALETNARSRVRARLQRLRDVVQPGAQVGHVSRIQRRGARGPRLTRLSMEQFISNPGLFALDGPQLFGARLQRLVQLTFEVRLDLQRVVKGAPTHIGERAANRVDGGLGELPERRRSVLQRCEQNRSGRPCRLPPHVLRAAHRVGWRRRSCRHSSANATSRRDQARIERIRALTDATRTATVTHWVTPRAA